MALIIIKLGGSLITRKHSSRPMLRLDIVRQLARELARLRRSGHLDRCVILHGAGSFGHPFVFRYQLNGRRLSARTISPVSQTIRSVDSLTTLMTAQLVRAGLPIVPLQTTSVVTGRNNRWQFSGQKILQQILRAGGIPLLSGQLAVNCPLNILTGLNSLNSFVPELSGNDQPM
jgi:isopentenyl phosphate kinase